MNPVVNEGGANMTLRNNETAPGISRNMFSGGTQSSNFQYSSVPVGYRSPYALFLPPKPGGMGTTANTVAGVASLAANLAAGKNIEAALSGTGILVASELQTVISMVANLTASGTISNAQLVSFVNMVAAISASGTMTATIGALSNLIADITASASMSPTMNATANLEADITPFTTLSPENLAAAVWNAIAADYNTAGTMGNKLNSAASGGVDYGALADAVWEDDNTARSTTGSAGKVLAQAKKAAKDAAALSA